MEELKKQLEAKRLILHKLVMEIRDLEEAVLIEEWKEKPECEIPFEGISANKCPHAWTYRSMVYCKNINCHK